MTGTATEPAASLPRLFNWNTKHRLTSSRTSSATATKYVAEAASHEAGHTLGLHHDGTPTSGYYSGRTAAAKPGWSSIMGVGYYQNLTQWSEASTRRRTSLKTTSRSSRRRTVSVTGPTTTATRTEARRQRTSLIPTTIDAAGHHRDDRRCRRLQPDRRGHGRYRCAEFRNWPESRHPGELYDGSGSLVTSANPAASLDAQLSANVSAGTYFLHVSGVGKGDPQGTRYSGYGSLGRYSFVGTIVDPGGLPGLTISDSSTTEGGVPELHRDAGSSSNRHRDGRLRHSKRLGDCQLRITRQTAEPLTFLAGESLKVGHRQLAAGRRLRKH